MSFPTSALSSTLNAIRSSMQRMERDAAVVAQGPSQDVAAGPPTSAPAGTAAAAEPTDTTGAVVDLLMVQRAFAAQLRVLEISARTMQDTIDIGRRTGGA